MNMNIRHLEEFDEYCRVIFLEFTQEYILNLLQFPSVFSGKRTKEYKMVRKFFLQELDKEGGITTGLYRFYSDERDKSSA